MKTRRLFIFLCLILVAQIPLGVALANAPLKPRVVVLTDVSTWETDDSESLVRLLAYADMFEIEALIYTTGWSLDETRADFFHLIHVAIDAYEKDLPNLMKRSEQTGHLSDENRQIIGYWPSADYLRERTVFGSKKRGAEFIGNANNSPGSDLIIQLADEDDERPLWITVWGGANTLAQAIWHVQQEYSDEQFTAFLHKLKVYTITDQDRDQKTPFNVSSHQWMRREFAKDLLFLWDESSWLYQNGTGKNNWPEYEIHIQKHGDLGRVYPKYKYGVEGDTPSFLHLMPHGLNDPLVPGQVGWGGYFEWGISPDKETYAYINHQGTAKNISSQYEAYFYPAIFNDFADRMDWAKDGSGNRNPVVVVNDNESTDILKLTAEEGMGIILDGSKSYDPDGDRLMFKWWFLPEAGTYSGELTINDSRSDSAKVIIPAGSAGETIHVICEVTDNSIPHLTSYRRIIIEPIK